MGKLSKSRSSKKYLEKNGVKSKPISINTRKKLQQANDIANEKIILKNAINNQNIAHSHETITTKALELVENIDKIKSPHKMEITSDEKFGSIEDYTLSQEQRDLKRYKEFINSSAYDDLKDIEVEISKEKKLTLNTLGKRSIKNDS